MTRDAMIWKEAAEVIARYPSAVDAIAECLERAKSAAPVAAEPPSLVAKAQRFVTLANTVWRDDTRDGRRAKELADAELSRLAGEIMAWTPAQAEPVATGERCPHCENPYLPCMTQSHQAEPAALPAFSPAAPVKE